MKVNHTDQRRRDDRNQCEVAEEVPPDEVVAHEQERDGEAHERGRHHGAQAQEQRVRERAQIVWIARERDEVGQRQAPRLVAERVVEDPQQRIDEEHEEEEPDHADADRR